MNGIRLSNPQIGVSQWFPDDAAVEPVHLYRLLAEEQINITFLTLFFADDAPRIHCCISPEKQAKVDVFSLCEGSGITCRPRIGTVSVYPHQFSFSALGYLLHVFAKEHFYFHQMASSGAMLTFVVDYADQEKIAAGLERHLDLPATRTPLRQEIDTDEILALYKKRPETSAEYVESKVRTYGINLNPGLTLCAMVISGDALADWGARIQTLEESGLRFSFVSADRMSDGRIQLYFLYGVATDGADIDLSVFSEIPGGQVSVQPDMCLISLQGPHFGDRYGIADQAFSVLAGRSVSVLLAACVGAMIYIVVSNNEMQQAKTLVSNVFETP
jgi:hypothetical protein